MMSGQPHTPTVLFPSTDFLYTLASRLDDFKGQHKQRGGKNFPLGQEVKPGNG
jgi:hypothetical protein